MQKHDYNNYFEFRGVDAATYEANDLPVYLLKSLPNDKSSKILDFGCGYAQNLRALLKRGYKNTVGVDIEQSAIDYCRENNLPVINAIKNDIFSSQEKYDFILLSHVLEHFPKDKIIETLEKLKSILTPGGKLFIMVPNAQSNTGAYWAYEDFTHYTLFTSGSIFYVLKKAGFTNIFFIDPDCMDSSSKVKKLLRRFFLYVYRYNYNFWNKVTGSSFHEPSQAIFSYELKVLAVRDSD